MAAGDNEREEWMIVQQQKKTKDAQREAEMQGEI